MTTTAKETNKDIWGVKNWVDPWMKAMQSWNSETQKLQQTTVDGMSKALDNGHALAKQGFGLAVDISGTVQRQMKVQFDRTLNLVSSFVER